MRILVTGGAGFIGKHVVEELSGHDVRVLDRVHGHELSDAAVVRRAVHGVDAIVHQAAKVGLGVDIADLPAYVADNDLGTAVLLAAAAAAGVRRLVLASSMVVYGEGHYRCAAHGSVRPGPRTAADLAAGVFEPRCPRCGEQLASGEVTEDAPLDPRNVYAATKVAQEHLVAAWARATSATAVALRYHNVYGPGMPRDTPYAGVAAIFRSALRRGEAPMVFEDGGQRRDFVHVRDVARANLAALTATEAASDVETTHVTAGALTAYNISSGEPRTVGEMATALAAACGGPDPVVTGAHRLGDVRHIVASPGRAAAELGFKAEMSFADGMREFATTTAT